ncbi:MAG TPA: TRAM domain-containing protein [Candidatus Sulfotelmatobacter sp.]|nr:TRAM domain-containing protein [Candidatus Sulfotelmatobacter sp.]
MSQSRFNRPSSAPSNTNHSHPDVPKNSPAGPPPRSHVGQTSAFWAIRLMLIGFTCLLCYNLGPFGFHGFPAVGLGFLMAMVILLAELRLRRAEISGLMGGTLGVVLGLLASLLITLVISRTAEPEPTKSFLEFTSLFVLGYLGLVVGSSKGQDLRQIPLPHSVELPIPGMQPMKLLDTSALIDGRIADICETHFLDGTLGIPRFVLHELQLVADSSDSLKRQRGRRGLEVLQRLQKMPWLEVRIVEEDIPGTPVVDQKLIELARGSGSKIVTNDFNLNRVARVQGIAVLNVNELANAMKPAVLPGESMRVLILREGKEPAQGVAYLDDGTMVVVDGARRFINRTIDIIVTSMHQTPAGKMIFGRVDDRGDSSSSRTVAVPHASGDGTSSGNGHAQAPTPPSPRFDPASPAAYTGQEPQ